MNNKYIVNGFFLPPSLIYLIEENKWCTFPYSSDISALPIEDKDDLTFFNVSEMIENTQILMDMKERGDCKLFALVDEEDKNSMDGFLRVNKAVMIAATYGQEALVLDYSVGDNPRVLATHYGHDGIRWIELAKSFDSLLEILNFS